MAVARPVEYLKVHSLWFIASLALFILPSDSVDWLLEVNLVVMADRPAVNVNKKCTFHCYECTKPFPVADPGFPPGGGWEPWAYSF